METIKSITQRVSCHKPGAPRSRPPSGANAVSQCARHRHEAVRPSSLLQKREYFYSVENRWRAFPTRARHTKKQHATMARRSADVVQRGVFLLSVGVSIIVRAGASCPSTTTTQAPGGSCSYLPPYQCTSRTRRVGSCTGRSTAGPPPVFARSSEAWATTHTHTHTHTQRQGTRPRRVCRLSRPTSAPRRDGRALRWLTRLLGFCSCTGALPGGRQGIATCARGIDTACWKRLCVMKAQEPIVERKRMQGRKACMTCLRGYRRGMGVTTQWSFIFDAAHAILFVLLSVYILSAPCAPASARPGLCLGLHSQGFFLAHAH